MTAVKAARRRYRQSPRGRAAHRDYMRRYRAANPGKAAEIVRRSRLRKLEQLAGRPRPAACEACSTPDPSLCWDHDHESGAFRGWICSPCNLALGIAKDNPTRLLKLAVYLETASNGR